MTDPNPYAPPRAVVEEGDEDADALVLVRRGRFYADSLRGYGVLIDGVHRAKVRNNHETRIPVTSGSHSIRLTIDWCSSQTLDFEIGVGQTVAFDCGPEIRGWRVFATAFLALYYLLLRRDRYIRLRAAPG